MIRVQNLVKKYGDFAAVQDLSFEVQQGEIFAFLGPNGAGKTTTIKMLTTLLKPTSGTVELDGLNPVVEHNEVRKRFGIVFQDPSLDDELTAFKNLDLHCILYKVPRKARHERIERLMWLFELWERRDDPVKQFSGGMKRRLEIARGLLHTPKILFLDEPTLGWIRNAQSFARASTGLRSLTTARSSPRARPRNSSSRPAAKRWSRHFRR